MIFHPDAAKLIKQARKTQTRRLATEPDCRYQPGRSYSVQPGRGKPGLCRITITDVRLEHLGNLTLKDAKREGFRTTQDFYEHWHALHGRVNHDQPVWVVSFVLGELADHPRLLAARPGPPHGDYTHQPHLAMAGEPEAVSKHYQDRFSERAQTRDDVRRRTDRAEKPLADRVQDLERRADAGESEAQRALFVISQRVQRVERGQGREAA